MSDQDSTKEILEAINASSSVIQEQFDHLGQEIISIKQEMGSMKQEMGSMKQEMATKSDLRIFEQKIIDHVDDRVADLEGALVTRERKADQKVNLILDILERHQVGTSDEIARVRQIKLFPTTPERV